MTTFDLAVSAFPGTRKSTTTLAFHTGHWTQTDSGKERETIVRCTLPGRVLRSELIPHLRALQTEFKDQPAKNMIRMAGIKQLGSDYDVQIKDQYTFGGFADFLEFLAAGGKIAVRTDSPSESWSKAELATYCSEHSVPVTPGKVTKTTLLTDITAHTASLISGNGTASS